MWKPITDEKRTRKSEGLQLSDSRLASSRNEPGGMEHRRLERLGMGEGAPLSSNSVARKEAPDIGDHAAFIERD
jgi:hypothetical protein